MSKSERDKRRESVELQEVNAELAEGANEQFEIGSAQQVATLPKPNQFVIFHVNPALVISPVPIVNPFIVGRVCSSGYHPSGTNPRLQAKIWFGQFSMIVVTIPKIAIREWHHFTKC